MIDLKGICGTCSRVVLHDGTGWWHRNGARVCSDRSSANLGLGSNPLPVYESICDYDHRPWSALPAGVDEIRSQLPTLVRYREPRKR